MKKLLIRFSVIFAFHVIFKAFDRSFNFFSEITERGIYFSIFFISFWMIIWFLGDLLNQNLKIKSENKNLKVLFHIPLAFLGGLMTSRIYYHYDVLWYGNGAGWEENSYINPELSVSLTIGYIIVYGIHNYFHKELELKEKALTLKQIEKEKANAELIALKSQLEPHFLFNNLGVLSSLIHEDIQLADDFIVKLSRVLRFVIEKNDKVVIPLKEELTLVDNYFFLLKTRFPNSISLTIKNEGNQESFLPATSLQTLIENAIKHNKHSKEEPLAIHVEIGDEAIVVKNNLNKRNKEVISTSLGLKNLQKRFEILNNSKIEIEKTAEEFKVKIPLLKQTDYENINH
jgi:hypothetical protein